MRITSKQLQQLIKEEVQRQLDEASLMQRVGSFFTGVPTDDDMMQRAADEIMYQIDITPPVWRDLYDGIYMAHRINRKALKMALKNKLINMPLTKTVVRSHHIEPKNISKTVSMMIGDLINFLDQVHKTHMEHRSAMG